MGNIDRTFRAGWHLLRFAAAVDSPLLMDSTSGLTLSAKPTGSVDVHSQDINYIELIAAIEGADTEAAVVNIYAGRHNTAPPGSEVYLARLVAQLTLIGGAGVVTFDPETGVAQGGTTKTAAGINRWCDTIALTEDAWLTDVFLGNDQGNERIAGVIFDLAGYEWMFAEVETLSAPEGVKLWWSYL